MQAGQYADPSLYQITPALPGELSGDFFHLVAAAMGIITETQVPTELSLQGPRFFDSPANIMV